LKNKKKEKPYVFLELYFSFLGTSGEEGSIVETLRLTVMTRKRKTKKGKKVRICFSVSLFLFPSHVKESSISGSYCSLFCVISI
jgi:hypothetical protein